MREIRQYRLPLLGHVARRNARGLPDTAESNPLRVSGIVVRLAHANGEHVTTYLHAETLDLDDGTAIIDVEAEPSFHTILEAALPHRRSLDRLPAAALNALLAAEGEMRMTET